MQLSPTHDRRNELGHGRRRGYGAHSGRGHSSTSRRPWPLTALATVLWTIRTAYADRNTIAVLARLFILFIHEIVTRFTA